MVDWYKFKVIVNLFNQNILFISVAVKNSNIQNSNFMYLMISKSFGTIICYQSITLHKLLERSVFGCSYIQSQLLGWSDGHLFNLLFMSESRMIEFYVSCRRYTMETLISIEKVSCYFSSCTLTTENALKNAFRPKLTLSASGIIRSIDFLIERFENADRCLVLLSNHVNSRSSLTG